MRFRRIIAMLMALCMLLGLSPHAADIAAAVATPEQELFFTIMHTNDEHSALLPSPLVDYDPVGNNPSSGGFARLAEAVQQQRQLLDEEPSLLVSAGDYLSGSPFSWLALEGQAPELRLMLDLGYDVITIGNHEYDYGPTVLAEYFQAAGYPEAAAQTAIVASNTVIPTDHPLNSVGIKSTHIQTLSNGLRVGLFGLFGIEATDVAPMAPPVTFSEQQAAAQAAVAELTAAGVDVIVAISHQGEDEERVIAEMVPGIDVIIGGHSHTVLAEPIVVSETLIVQTGTKLQHLGLLRLAYDPQTGKVRSRNQEVNQPFLLALDEGITFDPVFTAEIEYHTGMLNELLARMTGHRFNSVDQVVLHSGFAVPNKPELTETPFGNFVVDAMKIVGEQVTGNKVDFAIQANGVIRGGIQPSQLQQNEGQVALLDLVNLVGLGSGPDMQPGYPLVSFYFTGEEMRRVLEVGALLSELRGDIYFLQYAGLKMQYDPDRAILAIIPIKNLPLPTGRAILTAERYTGSGVQTSTVSGDYVPLERGDDQLYHVISDYYLAAFLPMVGEMLPSWALVMKDEDGNPLASVEDAIVYRAGQEMKVWQAVLEYSASLPAGPGGLPEMPAHYQAAMGRLVQVNTLPIWLWPATAASVAVAGLIWGIRKLTRRRRRVQA